MPEQPTKTQHSSKHILIVFGGLLALIAGMATWLKLWTPPISNTPPSIPTKVASLLPQLKTLPPFSLQDQYGQTFDNKRLLGHWTFLDFGYTHCPDICPTTLAMLARLESLLKPDKRNTPYEIAFVTIDPERDTRQRLAEYLDYFDASFLGISGNDEALRKLTRPLGILYQKIPTPKSALGYVMDHSTAIALIDPQGRYYALFSPPHDANMIADDFRLITRND